MPTNLENRIKISNRLRITRILKRICQASLPVIVRTDGDSPISVKGRASSIVHHPNFGEVLRIANISERGIAHVTNSSRLQVEFVMMATKVSFVSHVVAREDQSILISIPQSLISIERRKNARYVCTNELRAYLNLSCWTPGQDDLTSPPFYPHSQDIAGYLQITDLSFGGLCVVTRFPSCSLALRRGLIDDNARLVLPMLANIPIRIEVRWIKKIKEHHKDSEGHESYKRFYKFGAEFSAQSDVLKLGIRQFISQISQAGAI